MNPTPFVQWYKNASEWVDAKPKRERLLIALSLMALIFLIWNFVIQFSHDKRAAQLKAEQAQLMTEKKTTQDQLTGLVTAFSNDPAKIKQSEIEQLNLVLNDIEEKLLNVSQGLIAAENLPQVLESVFHETQGLELISVQTIAATEMKIAQIVPIKDKNSAESKVETGAAPENLLESRKPTIEEQAVGTGVYKHGVVLHLRGNYFRLIALLKSLESLSWKFYWESLDYKVVSYPTAEIELRVFTLSSEEGQLGV
jgi:MSHA biogenesis protein MshJ